MFDHIEEKRILQQNNEHQSDRAERPDMAVPHDFQGSFFCKAAAQSVGKIRHAVIVKGPGEIHSADEDENAANRGGKWKQGKKAGDTTQKSPHNGKPEEGPPALLDLLAGDAESGKKTKALARLMAVFL